VRSRIVRSMVRSKVRSSVRSRVVVPRVTVVMRSRVGDKDTFMVAIKGCQA
jgi:hypothetical protein